MTMTATIAVRPPNRPLASWVRRVAESARELLLPEAGQRQ
jgi:hypothetical protein